MIRFKLDPHIHTSEGSLCARIPGRLQAEHYKQAGYDGIVITDHFNQDFINRQNGLPWVEAIERFFGGYREAANRGSEIGLIVLPGMELRFPGDVNDYLVYGADVRFFIERPDLLDLGLAAFHALARREGIVVCQAHPFRRGFVPADPSLLDGVEVFNGGSTHDSRNHLAYGFAAENGLLMISGSDCHKPEEVGRGGIVVSQAIANEQELAGALRDGKIEELIGMN